MDAAGRSFRFVKRKLDEYWHWFSSRTLPNSSTMVAPPKPPLSPALDLEAGQASEISQQDPQSPDSTTEGAIAIHNPESSHAGGQGVDVPHVNPLYNIDWGGMVIGFCLTSAVEIALQSLQPQIQIPLLVRLLSLAMVFAFSSFFVSKYFISFHHFPRFAHVLIQIGKLSVFLAFFLAITVPFSLSFKLISWSICVLSLLAIAYVLAASGTLRHA